MFVVSLSRAGIEHAGAWVERICELRDRILDRRLEMLDVAAQRTRREFPQAVVNHDFFRASTIIVEPARQAASRIVNGSEAPTSATYSRSFHKRWRGVSSMWRRRRAIGSSIGARLVAIPAGLSRREKCL